MIEAYHTASKAGIQWSIKSRGNLQHSNFGGNDDFMRPVIHIALHFVVPFFVARGFYYDRWKTVWLTMLAMMIIDLDHLLADPVYDPGRCGVGFHPLHSYWAIGVYVVMTVVPVSRIYGLGLLIHIGLDAMDCVWIRLES